LRNGQRGSDCRYQKGAGHVARADRWRDAVERCVLSSTSQPALQLLVASMESHELISERCWDDDFGASQLFNRARTMIEKLAATLPVEDIGPALERLRGEFAVSVAR
jgi:hypothetical protein